MIWEEASRGRDDVEGTVGWRVDIRMVRDESVDRRL